MSDRVIDLVPVCVDCKHYLGGWQCAAFPRSAHDSIKNGENPHREPVGGEVGGFLFEWLDKARRDAPESTVNRPLAQREAR